MVFPGKMSTKGYTHVFFVCYSCKWMSVQGVAVKDRFFLRVILIMLRLSW